MAAQRNRRETCHTPGVRSGSCSRRPASARCGACGPTSGRTPGTWSSWSSRRSSGIGAGIVIPLVTKPVIDGPMARGDPRGLRLLGLLALALGCLEAVLAFVRRWMQSGTALGIETAIRNDLYAHLQRLPVAFHDRGSPASCCPGPRPTSACIRRFLVFGLIFLVVNIATFVTVRRAADPPVLAARPAWSRRRAPIPLCLSARLRAGRTSSASRQMQDQQGDLATLVEESAHGHPGRSRRSAGAATWRAQFDERRRARCTTRRWRKVAAAGATFWPLFDLVPNADAGASCCWSARSPSATGDADLGDAGRVRRRCCSCWSGRSSRWAGSSPTPRRR